MQPDTVARQMVLIVACNIESVEYMLSVLFPDANAGVGYFDDGLLHAANEFLLNRNCDASVVGRIFDGIRNEIHDNHVEVIGIDPHEHLFLTMMEGEVEAFFDDNGIEERADVLDQGDDLGLLERQAQPTIVDLPDVDQLIDQLNEHLRISEHGLIGILPLGIMIGGDELLQWTYDQRKRGLYLMRNIGEELQLGIVDLQGPLVLLNLDPGEMPQAEVSQHEKNGRHQCHDISQVGPY